MESLSFKKFGKILPYDTPGLELHLSYMTNCADKEENNQWPDI